MSIHLQPPVTLVKTEPPTVIKNEPPEEVLEEISSDVKEDIDIVYHPLCEALIKSETVLKDILENKHLESVRAQALVVKTENSPFIKTENLTKRIKSEDISDGNVSKDTGQGVVEVQDSHDHSNTLSNLETHEQLVLNSSNGTTSWEKEKEKIKIIRACDIPIESHEYTSLAKDKYVCNHCQHAFKVLSNLRRHIKQLHRKLTTMHQCPYCPYKTKWNVQRHIIQNHKDTKDIQWLQCNLCEMKFKFKSKLTRHMKVHLRHKQMKDGLDLREKRYHCDNCDYKTDDHHTLKRHKLIHLKPEEIQYFCCYHCSNKFKRKDYLKSHIFRYHFKIHLKPEEIQYFYCYHCSNKFKRKDSLKYHIFRYHFKNVKQEKSYHCDNCDYETYRHPDLKVHKLTHLKPEEIQYFYCCHCSFKSKYKKSLKAHIFTHFKKEQVEFDCYICNFVTSKRESINKHIKKHSKVQKKIEINEGN